MNKTILKWIVAAVLAVMTLTSTAAPVGVDAARSAATNLLKHRSQGRAVATGVTMTLAHAEASTAAGAVDYYVFNASDGGSFAIIAGDDRANAVLGYGDGTLDMNRLPCGMQCLLEQFKEQMDWLNAHPGAVVERSPQYAPTDGSVMPLLTCSWSQSEPYYNLCPTDANGEHAVTGCIATAMAQVMYYWRYPSRLPAIDGYRYQIFELEDLPACTLDWDNMLDQYLGEYNEVQATAIATLMRYCGQGCHMMYGVDGSGSYMSSQRGAIIKFGYNSGIGSRNRDSHSATSWTSLMRDELNAGRPILYTAQANGGGHAFVIDGWYNGMFHINWGWAGTGNGYFALDAFNVRGYAFNSDQAMLTGVRPGSGSGGNETVIDFDMVVDNICYKVDADGATVTGLILGHGSDIGDVVIPDHVTADSGPVEVTAIGSRAFMNYTGLTGVTIPSTVKTIGKQAFRNCSGLTSVTVPDEVCFIGEQAFAHCVSLEQVTLPAALTMVDFDAFEGCVGLQSVDISDVAAWCGVHFSNNNANPLYFARHLLLDGHEATTLVIPSAVTAVSRSAFINCTSLRQLVVEEGVQSLERASFSYCDNLASVTLPSTLATIGQSSFYGCTALTELYLPDGLQTVGAGAFYGCSALPGINFPVTVTSVGAQAFEACESMSEVHIADLAAWCRIRFGDENANPLMAAGHLLMDGKPIEHLVLPAGIDTIRPNTFAGDMDLKRVEVASNIRLIGDRAFMRCRNLETVKLGSGLECIGEEAFKGCTSLTSAIIPDRVTTMGNGAFNNCSSMRHITFGESVETIGKEMCDGCKSLETLVIGSKVEIIGSMAFYSCRNLTSVTCKATSVPQLAGQACFNGDTYKNALLKVPSSAEPIYREATFWKNFKNIEGADIHHHQPGDVNADGSINIADVNALIAAILSGSDDPALDVNEDGNVNITDINAVINLILDN